MITRKILLFMLNTHKKGGNFMIKYNYAGAAALWNELYNLCFNPWDLDNKQKQRREFMRDITRDKKKYHIDFLWDRICFSSIDYKTNAETRKYIRDLDNLLTSIIDFKGVL